MLLFDTHACRLENQSTRVLLQKFSIPVTDQLANMSWYKLASKHRILRLQAFLKNQVYYLQSRLALYHILYLTSQNPVRGGMKPMVLQYVL
jgi:hypothetical protein